MNMPGAVRGSYSRRTFYASICVVVMSVIIFSVWAVTLLQSIRRTQFVAAPVVSPSMREQVGKVQELFHALTTMQLPPESGAVDGSKERVQKILEQNVNKK